MHVHLYTVSDSHFSWWLKIVSFFAAIGLIPLRLTWWVHPVRVPISRDLTRSSIYIKWQTTWLTSSNTMDCIWKNSWVSSSSSWIKTFWFKSDNAISLLTVDESIHSKSSDYNRGNGTKSKGKWNQERCCYSKLSISCVIIFFLGGELVGNYVFKFFVVL